MKDGDEDNIKDGVDNDSDLVRSSDDDFINNTNNKKKNKNVMDQTDSMDVTLKADCGFNYFKIISI